MSRTYSHARTTRTDRNIRLIRQLYLNVTLAQRALDAARTQNEADTRERDYREALARYNALAKPAETVA
jgi:hypothetical protein